MFVDLEFLSLMRYFLEKESFKEEYLEMVCDEIRILRKNDASMVFFNRFIKTI